MDQRTAMTAMARPNPDGTSTRPDEVEDDPLVELARIVSGRSTSEEPQRRSVFVDEPALSEADLARDLEVELLSDLQASFAAAGDVDDDQPPFYAEEDISDDVEAYTQRPVEDPPAQQFTEDYRAAEYPDQTEALEAFDDRLSRPDEGQPSLESSFEDVGLRDGSGGPAFNPSALSTGQPRSFEGADDGVPEEPLTGWAATADGSELGSLPEDSVAGEDFGPGEEAPFDPAYDGSLAAADAFAADAPMVAPPPTGQRHRDRRLDADPEGVRARPSARRRTSGRNYTVFGVLALVAIGTAAVLVLRGGDPSTGEPPLITADNDATRVFPAEAPAVDNADNVVFQRTDPDDALVTEENLLPGAEPMADIAAATEANDGITQILTPTDPADAVGDADTTRMVRTVTVLTDGTIVENGTEPVGDGITEPATAEGAEPITNPANVEGNPAVGVANDKPPAAETVVPAEDPPAAETVVPAEDPPAVETPAVVAVATPNTPAAGDAIATGRYVQVAALGTEALAQSILQEFRTRAPGLLQNQPAAIQRAELAAGVFYRVWFGPLSSAEAESLRQGLAAVGIDSFIQAQN